MIGSRGSDLALKQTAHVKNLLQEGRKDQSGDFMEGVGLDDSQTDQIIAFIDNNNQSNQQLEEFKEYLSNYKDYPIKFDSLKKA